MIHPLYIFWFYNKCERTSKNGQYAEAFRRAPQFKSKLNKLPRMLVRAIGPHLTPTMTEDEYHDVVEIYYSFKTDYTGRALQKKITHELESRRKCARRSHWLNSFSRNISLDQCIEDSIRPVSDWLNLEQYLE